MGGGGGEGGDRGGGGGCGRVRMVGCGWGGVQDLKLWANYGLVVSKKLTVFQLGLWDPFVSSKWSTFRVISLLCPQNWGCHDNKMVLTCLQLKSKVVSMQ